MATSVVTEQKYGVHICRYAFRKRSKNEILNGVYDYLVNENIIYGIQIHEFCIYIFRNISHIHPISKWKRAYTPLWTMFLGQIHKNEHLRIPAKAWLRQMKTS
jgi:hypothetical protein